ncbi:MAG: transglycosylase domain-containing protein [Oscillospiraceae bacterium]|nr:transglycosylase domain-containing protein [Oscillospiraceae bacterium]
MSKRYIITDEGITESEVSGELKAKTPPPPQAQRQSNGKPPSPEAVRRKPPPDARQPQQGARKPPPDARQPQQGARQPQASSAKPRPKQPPKKNKRKVHPVKRTIAVIGTTLLSLILLAVITGSIVAAAMVVYVINFAEEYRNDVIDIDPFSGVNLDYTSFIYGYDETGNPVELASISRGANRIPVKLEQVPKHVQDAFVYTEDERFYEHHGVDWKRTFTAFINEILQMWGRQGGSTITQQLVKNVTGDDDENWERKMREIFRASYLEQYVPKSKILEAYLNWIGFGGSAHGIQAASMKYFGKDVSELTIAEGASLAAIPKNPNIWNPFANLDMNLERQKTVLLLMYQNAAISENEYREALAEELIFRDPNAPSDDDKLSSGIQSWFVDMVIRDVTWDLARSYGVSLDEASDMLYNGGYEVYATVDLKMQEALEAKYKDWTTFSSEVRLDPPNSAAICIDYMGNIKAVVGGIGEKAGSNIWSHADRAERSPGSCIKPIASYSYAIEHDLMTWSTIHINKPLDNWALDESTGRMRQGPYNYNSRSWDHGGYFTFQALQRSLNTVPAQLVQKATPPAVFDFLQYNYRITTLSAYDAALAPLSIGALTTGMHLKELVASYQPFGNAGIYYSPTTYTRVVDSNGRVILENKYIPFQSLNKETAYVMNKLMQTVIEGPNGTGRAAKLPNVTVVGKTGTSDNWHDITFVGCTPEYVSGIWYGYDTPKAMQPSPYYGSAQVWKNVFGDIMEEAGGGSFPSNPDVRELYFCSNTGLIASGSCPTGGLGYYKSTNVPSMCSGNHGGG